MTSATYTYDFTRAHTATHLTDVILGTIGDILSDLKINTWSLSDRWEMYEDAIKAWITEGSLGAVILECLQPSGSTKPVIEFPVTYNCDGAGDSEFTASRARMARFLAKLDRVPAGTTFRLVCTFIGTPSQQPGWSDTTRASTSTMRSLNFGTIGSAPHASAGMRYHY